MMHSDHRDTILNLLALPAKLEDAGWRQVRLPPGETLWKASEAAEELAIVADGRLELSGRGCKREYAERGDIIGVAAAFFEGEKHFETPTAEGPTELWLLPSSRLKGLRAEQTEFYAQLLSIALSTQGELVSRLAQHAAELSKTRRLPGSGQRPSVPPAPRWWEGFGPPKPPEPILPVLRRLPVLCAVDEHIVHELARAMRPHVLREGQRLFAQGEVKEQLVVIASGQLRCYWEDQEKAVYDFATAETGGILNLEAFLEGRPAVASCYAASHVSVWLLDAPTAAHLSSEANLTLRETLLAASQPQYRRIRDFLGQLDAREGHADFETLFSAMSGLQGWQAGAPSIDITLASLPLESSPVSRKTEKETLLRLIRQSIVGRDEALETPFGLRRVIYADYTASGRSLNFIEDYMRREVMPLYANTHTEASESGRQTTSFREEAREIVARSLGADEDYEVVFVGSGATGAIQKLIDILNLRLPPDVAAQYHLEDQIPKGERPVVFHGPYEHHSNILPWRHSIADVVVIPLSEEGGLDTTYLEKALIKYKSRPLRIGSFSAASNVTGVATDVKSVASLLHRYGALSFWDYAAAAPYVRIEMTPEGSERDLSFKDAVFLSPHKFIGGPGTPGVLCVRKEIVRNTVPTQPGGGTVDFVTGGDALYSDSIKHREEAGTPAILESIRCGLVFRVKDQVGAQVIHEREKAFVNKAIDSWRQNPKIRILGSLEAERLSIVSFMIRHGARFLHHNFVIALLNDLFGVQARGGCSCAGPYGAALLGLGRESGDEFLRLVNQGWSSLKPGWARVNFNYFISEEEFQYVVSAIHLIAVYGYALMPAYTFRATDGLWVHKAHPPRDTKRLSDLRIDTGKARWESRHHHLPERMLTQHLREGRAILEEAAASIAESIPVPDLTRDFEAKRWFPLPHEVSAYLRHQNGGDDSEGAKEMDRESVDMAMDTFIIEGSPGPSEP